MTFKESVLKAVAEIPEGETVSYKKVATMAGNPGAARAVGSIMNRNRDVRIPCHRVIRSDGGIGGYNRGSLVKERMLREERKKLHD